jgi:flavodoxin
MSKILVAYFSRAQENWAQGGLRSLRVGNTEVLAEEIAKQTGGSLFRIEAEEEYPSGYYACTEKAKAEKESGLRPKLKKSIDVSNYDTVFLGCPNWWGTCPMPVFAFIEENHCLAGKKVIPFVTHEGSAFGQIVRDLKKECPQAQISDNGLALQGSYVMNAPEVVRKWLPTIK